MDTITFYSYKGGVGRSLALANVASYLVKFGFNVFLLDFDLEAPGLHYKFPEFTDSIKSGLVDYIYEYTNNKTLTDSLEKYILKSNKTNDGNGSLTLMPAGNVFYSDYWTKLSSIDWKDLIYASGNGIPLFLDLKEKISEKYKPDFLLIDSRTGVTEMSSLCTSILPDKVVFLVANNKENIEGARQIFRAIQSFEGIDEQNKMEVVFALTRLPKQEKSKDENILINNIRNFLNEPYNQLENQIDIKDICVLHSDRGLELSETLVINEKINSSDTPLLRDYLNLFSKIIPSEYINKRLSSILEGITDKKKLFEEPDKVQYELEEMVKIYHHPLTLERLIDFYILRNAELSKILDVYNTLWTTFGIDKKEILQKYANLYMKNDTPYWSSLKFNLDIIVAYLNLNYKQEIQVKLAGTYKDYRQYEKALMHYKELLKISDDIKSILEKLLDVFIYADNIFDKEMSEIFTKYDNVISEDLKLYSIKLKLLHKYNKIPEIKDCLNEDLTEYFAEIEPVVYYQIMNKMNNPEMAILKLSNVVKKAINNRDGDKIFEIGRLFYDINKVEEFKKIVGNDEYGNKAVEECEKRYNRKKRPKNEAF